MSGRSSGGSFGFVSQMVLYFVMGQFEVRNVGVSVVFFRPKMKERHLKLSDADIRIS